MTGLLVAAAAVAAVAAVLFNRLVRDRNRVDAAWSDIDVQLQRRYDLIPRLVEAVDHYAGYEKATLTAVTALRTASMALRDAARPAELGAREAELGEGLQRLLAVAERYPDLKASENFLSLQRALAETENYLQFARRFYNGAVRQYNTRAETVPNNLLAATFGFRPREFFQKSADEAAAVPLVDFGHVE